MNPRELYAELVAGGHTLAIHNGGKTRFFNGHGIADLHRILTTAPALLKGSTVADKIVGKGAAALMISGGVKLLYTAIISQGALSLIDGSEITADYGEAVDHIINRAGSGWCPVERLCRDSTTADECLALIDNFVNHLK